MGSPRLYIVDGDGSFDDVSPVPHYGEEWNKLPKEVFDGVLHYLDKVYNERNRVVLPNELHIKTVSDKYIKILSEVL